MNAISLFEPGATLKDVTNVAIVNASHRGGYIGTPLTTFLPWFLSEFSLSSYPKDPSLDPTCDLAKHLKEEATKSYMIPFFAGLNSSWTQPLIIMPASKFTGPIDKSLFMGLSYESIDEAGVGTTLKSGGLRVYLADAGASFKCSYD